MTYTCPMHPEVQQDHPGDCPKCGMALEPLVAGETDDENGELHDMTRRCWAGAAFTLPVFVLAMAHLIPALARQPWVEGGVSRWTQFILTGQVVGWAGWPFFRRGWHSVMTRELNMFTLITIGVGAAFSVSALAMLAPGTLLTRVGLPGLAPLPWWQVSAIFAYAMVSCLLVNDSIKVAMVRWRVPAAVA